MCGYVRKNHGNNCINHHKSERALPYLNEKGKKKQKTALTASSRKHCAVVPSLMVFQRPAQSAAQAPSHFKDTIRKVQDDACNSPCLAASSLWRGNGSIKATQKIKPLKKTYPGKRPQTVCRYDCKRKSGKDLKSSVAAS